MAIVPASATMALAIWCYLILARGGFWLTSERDDPSPDFHPAAWPAVTGVMPARNEADVIAQSLSALLAQDYPGPFHIVLVDDQSSDATAEVAAATAARMGATERLTIVPGRPRPTGWSGKVFAMKQGVDVAGSLPRPADYLLFVDADIALAPGTLRQLALRAQSGRLVLASLMAKLHCETWAERALIPAFVFFFAMLYPFKWVNAGKAAAAAGGVMLVRRDALREAGGIEAIRSALIDDCALARRLRQVGPIRLSLTEQARSLRAYSFNDIRRMVSRTAYDQLRYSPLLLAATLVAMALTFLAPPVLALFASGWSQLIGTLAWGAMALSFQPMLRFYRASPIWGIALPAIAAAYMLFTLESALQHARGRGGLWKGRLHANTSGTAA